LKKDNITLIAEPEKDYELLDSGDGEKLERYGRIVLSRHDPQAIWPKADAKQWHKADAIYGDENKALLATEKKEKGRWIEKTEIPSAWPILFGGLVFHIRLSAFKHTGIFPEHKSSWEWINDAICREQRQISILNLFGYTGGATLTALKAGAKVTHLDGSRVAINWGKENAKSSGLSDKPVRWIIDDAVSFVQREIRRGNKYDGIIMDPPSYGRGPNGEKWQIEDDLLKLLLLCKEILSDNPSFILLNGYAAGYSALSYANILSEVFPFMKEDIEYGEIGIRETARNIILPAGIFARWNKPI